MPGSFRPSPGWDQGVTHLGQSGFRWLFGDTVVYIDPYLSDQVEKHSGPLFRRLVPPVVQPSAITDADFVLISHEHIDHCDVETLVPISINSPTCRFIGPRNVASILAQHGIANERLVIANRNRIDLAPQLMVQPIPAAHKQIEFDAEGYSRFLGYVVLHKGRRLLHTGDTCVHASIAQRVRDMGAIDIAFLPVNECNYYRDRIGIIGNMSVREAFQFATEIDAGVVVPMHFDMFAPNQVYPEEIEVVYRRLQPDFVLCMNPGTLHL